MAKSFFNGVDYKPLTEWLPKAAAEHNMKYIHGFYNGNKIGVTNSATPNINYLPGHEVPVWTGSAAMSGCLAAMAAFSRPFNYWGDLSELSMTPEHLNELFVSIGNQPGA